MTAYQITKSNKLFNVYNGEGVFRFILNEVQLTKDDDVVKRIADYKSRLSGDCMVAGLVPVYPDFYVNKEMDAILAEENGESTEQEAQKEGWI